MSYAVTRLELDDLEDVLELFDAVQAWLAQKGLKEQWGERPFSESEAQRKRFGAWLASGRMVGVRSGGRRAGTLVFSFSPPDYAEELRGRAAGGYLEAFAVRRDFAGRGVGAALLGWAEGEALDRGWTTLYLDCWAGNAALRAYYRRAGYSEVSTLTRGAWRGVLLEKKLEVLL